jgi:hypothetical protein
MNDRNAKIEVALEWPLDYRGKRVEKVFVRRPRGADSHLAPADAKRGSDMFPFIAALVSLPNGDGVGLEFLDELDLVDIGAINEIIAGFQKRDGQSQATLKK